MGHPPNRGSQGMFVVSTHRIDSFRQGMGDRGTVSRYTGIKDEQGQRTSLCGTPTIKYSKMIREALLLLSSILIYTGSAHKLEKAAATPTRYNAWAAGSNNCSCAADITALKRELLQESHQRQELKGALETYVSELYELRGLITALKNATKLARATALSAAREPPAIAFTSKLSYNRELQPLDTVIFDTIITNNGEGYNSETGKFTAPLSGTYYFFASILSGYNTKVETALIVNDKEVSRMYSGAHDAHGSGSNSAVVNLRSGDSVWVRLLYQGGTHVHGFYSTFSGFILNEKDP